MKELKSNGVCAVYHQLLTKLKSASLQTVAGHVLPELLSGRLGTLVRQLLSLVPIETIKSQLPPVLRSSFLRLLDSQQVPKILTDNFSSLVRHLPPELRSASLRTILDQLSGDPVTGTEVQQMMPLVPIKTIESQQQPQMISSVFWTAVRQLYQLVRTGTPDSHHVPEITSVGFRTLVHLLHSALRSASFKTIIDQLLPGVLEIPVDQLPPEPLPRGIETLFLQLLSGDIGTLLRQLLSEKNSPAFIVVYSSDSGYDVAR